MFQLYVTVAASAPRVKRTRSAAGIRKRERDIAMIAQETCSAEEKIKLEKDWNKLSAPSLGNKLLITRATRELV